MLAKKSKPNGVDFFSFLNFGRKFGTLSITKIDAKYLRTSQNPRPHKIGLDAIFSAEFALCIVFLLDLKTLQNK